MEMTRRPRPAALGLKVSPYGSECQDSPPEPEQRRPGCLHLWRAVNQTHLSALSSALPLTLIAGWSRWKIESWRTSWNISSRLNLWHQLLSHLSKVSAVSSAEKHIRNMGKCRNWSFSRAPACISTSAQCLLTFTPHLGSWLCFLPQYVRLLLILSQLEVWERACLSLSALWWTGDLWPCVSWDGFQPPHT